MALQSAQLKLPHNCPTWQPGLLTILTPDVFVLQVGLSRLLGRVSGGLQPSRLRMALQSAGWKSSSVARRSSLGC